MTLSPYDIVLRSGTVVDGSGDPRFEADVAIVGDRIVAIGRLEHAIAHREIDVTGLIVAPGFIDVHTHDDAAVILQPEMLPKLAQGVTTVIAGNCGISGAPYRKTSAPSGLLRLVFKSDRCLAADAAHYFEKVVDAKPAVNIAVLTGHTTLRMEILGDDLNRTANAGEIAAMRDLLVESLEQGSLGLSTGLFYPPARAASTDEVIGIANALCEHQGLYVTHMRDEADGVMASIEESLTIGRVVGAQVVISHHKCMGEKNFGRSIETVARLERARREQRVAWDLYPYTVGSSILNVDLVRQSSRTIISWCDPHPELAGCELAAAATVLGCTRDEAITKLQPAGAMYFMMHEEDVVRIMSSAGAMIGSDGLPGDAYPHPRLWGTFPRVLGRYVREQEVLSLEEAVYRMSGLSAGIFGLHDRGRIEVGAAADLTIFDANAIADRATFEQPTQPAAGVHYVFVNGELAMNNGAQTSARAGKVLRRTCTNSVDGNRRTS